MKANSSLICLFLISTICPVASCMAAPEKTKDIPRLQELSLAEKKIVSMYGGGVVTSEDKWNSLRKTRTYRVKDDQIWIQFRMACGKNRKDDCSVREILITKNQLSNRRVVISPRDTLLQLVLHMQKKIDLPILESKYGKPTSQIKLPQDIRFSVLKEYFGFKTGTIVRYLPQEMSEMLFAEFYFDPSGLNTILISIEE
ncbi:MAG: hypothetical protein NDI60_10555 [Elusimicrobiales bacterium]|nr:hypothetical protein [Elusimicrobiales bacterium]